MPLREKFNNYWRFIKNGRGTRITGILSFLGWSLVFGVIYAQSPLYSSNQNQYFLHGLARAGVGFLKNDWLANTIDPLPLFSALVYITVRIFPKDGFYPADTLFYFYYALLMGVYLAGMLSIMDTVFDLSQIKIRKLSFIVLFLFAHSALLHFFLSRFSGTETPFLIEGGVAAQRMLGQVFQPSTFGVFLVLSIALFLRDRLFLSLLALAVAVYFHPVYLLTAALLTLAYLWVIYRKEHNLKRCLLFGVGAILLVSPALAYTMIVFWPTSGALTQQINHMLVHFRNPHHAIVSQWLDWTVLFQALIVLVGLFIVRKTRLFPILAILTLGVLFLTSIQLLTGNDTLALLYPWRTSVLLVPVSTCILLAFINTKAMDFWKPGSDKLEKWFAYGSLVIISGLITVGAIRFQIETARQHTDEALPMMIYVAEHKTPDDVYLVPSKMENFRLVTGAPIYVDFKSVPYRDQDVQEWYRRVRWVDAFYRNTTNPCKILRTAASSESITHVVVEAESPVNTCTGVILNYQDDHFRIYSLNPIQ